MTTNSLSKAAVADRIKQQAAPKKTPTAKEQGKRVLGEVFRVARPRDPDTGGRGKAFQRDVK